MLLSAAGPLCAQTPSDGLQGGLATRHHSRCCAASDILRLSVEELLAPPWAACSVTERLRLWVPVPHVFEQALHSLNEDVEQCTGHGPSLHA